MSKFSVVSLVYFNHMYRHFNCLLFAICFFLCSMASTAKADILDDINSFLRSGNIAEISKHLAANVELEVLSKQNSYTKAQAVAVLADFFKKNQPKSSKIVHKISSNPAHLFGVMILDTSNGEFRTSVSVSNSSGKLLITEIRFELNKD